MNYRIPLALILTAVVSPAVAQPHEQDPPKPAASWRDAPADDDGYRDYVAYLNKLSLEGVPLENNAFVGFLSLDDQRWDPAHRTAVWALLGEEPPEEPVLFAWYGGDDPESQKHFDLALEQPWTPDQAILVDDWLVRYGPALDLVAEHLKRPGYAAPLVTGGEDTTLMGVVLPQASLQMSVGRGLIAQANRRMAEQDFDGAWANIEHVRKLGAHVSKEPHTIANLVAIRLHGMAGDAAVRLANQPWVQPQQLRQIAKQWSALPGLEPIARSIDRGERFMLPCLVMHLRHGKPGGMAVIRIVFTQGKVPDFQGLTQDERFDMEAALDLGDDWYDQMVRIANTPDYEVFQKEAEAFKKQVRAMSDSPIKLVTAQSREAYSTHLMNMLGRIFLPALDAAIAMSWDQRTRADMVPVAIALRLHASEHGRYPQTLDELVPKYLESLPADRFTKEPLRYVHADDHVLLYSVGKNQTDDGGDTHDKKDIVFRLPK